MINMCQKEVKQKVLCTMSYESSLSRCQRLKVAQNVSVASEVKSHSGCTRHALTIEKNKTKENASFN